MSTTKEKYFHNDLPLIIIRKRMAKRDDKDTYLELIVLGGDTPVLCSTRSAQQFVRQQSLLIHSFQAAMI